VAAARELVITGGLEALSLRRLAAQLGVTAPALYAHVKDKSDLLRALAEDEFDRLVARFDRVAAATDAADPVARIRAHGRAYVEHAREQPELFRVMFVFPPELSPADVPGEVQLPAATRAFAAASAAVEEAVASGALEGDPLVMALTFWAGAHGLAQVLQLGFGLPAELEDQLIDEMVGRLVAGYQPRG
jgi:AcrR family transcriptional regulator